MYPTFVLGVTGVLFLIPIFFFKETLGKPIKDYVDEDKPKDKGEKNNNEK